MATIHKTKIGSVASLAAGATSEFKWNNPPWNASLSYFAYPVPPAASGEHGTKTGFVQITKVICTHKRDNHNGDSQYVMVHVKNTGTAATGFDLYQSWIT